MKLHFCIFILFFGFIFNAVKSDLDEPCIDIDKNPGTCINLKKCPKLLNMLMESVESEVKHREAIDVLQKSNCGFYQQDPYVCCSNVDPGNKSEESPNHTTTEVSYQRPQSTEVSSTVSAAVSSTTEASAEKNVTTEKNVVGTDDKLKLLPQDCGSVLTFKHFFGSHTDLDDFPWTTLIEYDTPSGKRFACGGALISEKYVLTAAHCVSGLESSWKVTGARFGEYDTRTDVDCLPDEGSDEYCAEEPVNVAIEEIIPHPGFESENPNRPHDIALLRLAEKVSFSYFVKPICLPLEKPIPQRYYTSGWGKDIARNGTSVKYMSYLTLDKPQACAEKYRSGDINLSPYQICAGIKLGEKPCTGDEGGPLMGIEERIDQSKKVAAFGILSITRSSGDACEGHGLPGVYTKVLDYMPWILSNLNE